MRKTVERWILIHARFFGMTDFTKDRTCFGVVCSKYKKFIIYTAVRNVAGFTDNMIFWLGAESSSEFKEGGRGNIRFDIYRMVAHFFAPGFISMACFAQG